MQSRRAALRGWLLTGVVLALVAAGGSLPSTATRAAGAVDALAQGPRPSTALGAFVRAKDHGGNDRDFRSLRGKRGLILIFSRSFDW